MAFNQTWRQIYLPDGSTTMVLIESIEVPDPEPMPPSLEQQVIDLRKEIELLKSKL